MSNLFVLRHGQASFHGPHYDQLSSLGHEQGVALGAWWAQLGQRWDYVFMGPKKRHHQTAVALAEGYAKAGASLPEPMLMPEFNEHQGASVVKSVLSEDLAQEDDTALLPGHIKDQAQVNMYFERFQEITLAWAAGKLVRPEFENWQAFRSRVEAGITKIMRETERGANTLVVSSGGPVSITTGMALGLDDAATLALSWKVRNGAFTECLYDKERLTLVAHNATPGFDDKQYFTMI